MRISDWSSDVCSSDLFSRATERLKNHVFDYCITDSGVERDFVGELDTSAQVEVYAKLPRGFLIPTPVGDYNPDWAIVFRAGAVKHIYFVAEPKGSMYSLARSEEHTSELQSLLRISYAVFCLKK